MPNWTHITSDDLKAAGHGTIVDRASTTATGGVDPVAEEIANAVARVRRAVAAANAVDADSAKVPKSLKGLTMRLALYALMERIRFPLSEDQRDSRKNDNSDLLRISDRKSLVEAPDNPEATPAVPVHFGDWNSERKVLGRTHPVPAPGRQYAPGNQYANPTGPEDSAV